MKTHVRLSQQALRELEKLPPWVNIPLFCGYVVFGNPRLRAYPVDARALSDRYSSVYQRRVAQNSQLVIDKVRELQVITQPS